MHPIGQQIIQVSTPNLHEWSRSAWYWQNEHRWNLQKSSAFESVFEYFQMEDLFNIVYFFSVCLLRCCNIPPKQPSISQHPAPGRPQSHSRKSQRGFHEGYIPQAELWLIKNRALASLSPQIWRWTKTCETPVDALRSKKVMMVDVVATMGTTTTTTWRHDGNMMKVSEKW